MKKIILLSIVFLNIQIIFAGENKPNLVVYYFGATSCGWCNTPECVESIIKLHKEFAKLHKEYKVKFVMVCMDVNIEEGLKFISKYGYWDEISVGSWYQNELIMNYLDKTKVPGMPHVIVFKDIYENEEAPIIKERKMIQEKFGARAIKEWADNNFPLE
jgi:hypothetical protein